MKSAVKQRQVDSAVKGNNSLSKKRLKSDSAIQSSYGNFQQRPKRFDSVFRSPTEDEDETDEWLPVRRKKSSRVRLPSHQNSVFSEQLATEKQFLELAHKWSEDTVGTSSITKKITHPNYLSIIAMGSKVLPLILRELKERPNHWFVALKAIAGTDPARPGDNFDEAVNAWLQWGNEENLID